MPTEVPVSLKLKAVDGITKVLNKATNSLGRIKKATQKASNAFKNFQEKTKGMRQSIGKVGTGFKNVGKSLSTKVTLPIVGLAAGIIQTAATFEKSMNKVKALSGATGEAFESLRNEAARLGSSTQFSASQAADGMAFLAQAGFKTNDILKATAPLLDLAAASSTDLAQTADIASNVMGAFGIKADETARVADVLARATAGSNVDLNMIAESMKAAAPIAKEFGASLEETTAAVGLLGNIGIQGSAAGTALKRAFLGLSAPTSKASKVLKGLGIRVTDEQGNMLKFDEIMKNLGGRLSDLPQAGRLQALDAVFGKIGISAASNLAKVASTGELKKFISAMSNTEITASKMAKTMNSGAAGAMTEMKSAMEGLAIAIAGSGPDSPLSAFTSIVRSISSFIQEISSTNPEIFKMAIIAAGLVAALGPLLLIFGGLISIIPTLITIAGALGVGFGVVAASALAIPIAIAALVAAGIWLMNNWAEVKEFFAVLWTTISSNFLDSIAVIQKAFEFAFGGFGSFVERQWTSIKETFNEGISFLLGLANKALGLLPDFIKTKIGITPEIEKSLNNPLGNLSQGLGTSTGQVQNNVVKLGKERELRRAETPTNKNESKVSVKFENPPQGMTLKTESTDDSLFSVDTGLQASAL